MLLDCGLKKVYTTKKKFVFEIDEFKESRYDKIITKSVTRFARNVEVISIWRLLEEKGVYIYFQDINKDTSNKEDSLILNLSLTLSEQESVNISERTKWGNKASAEANIIRNNELYGYRFDRATNSLIIVNEEADVVRLIFELCIQGNGYRLICKKLQEKGIVNKKGKLFSMSTIKNMICNKKYCGYNVRHTWESVGLFTENHTYKRTKQEEWIVKKNDRIEPIVTEEVFEKAQNEISKRLSHSNKGKNRSKRDTMGKIVCAYCGKSFYICHSKSIGSAVNSNPYYICATKKVKGKAECQAENLSLKIVDDYINDLRKYYLDNIDIKNKASIKKIQLRLDKLNVTTDKEVITKKEFNCQQINKEQEKIQILLSSFVTIKTEVLRNAIQKQIEDVEDVIMKLEQENINLDSILIDRKMEQKKLEHQINELKKELLLERRELTRGEIIDKLEFIKIYSKDKIKPIWKV